MTPVKRLGGYTSIVEIRSALYPGSAKMLALAKEAILVFPPSMFAVGDSCFEVDRLDSRVAPRSASAVPVQVASALSKVADPELREIMESVLEEDADLITYLRRR